MQTGWFTHDLDAASDDEAQVSGEANVVLKGFRYIINTGTSC